MGVEFACDWIRLCHAQEPVESVTSGCDSWRVSALRCLAPGGCRGTWDLIKVEMVCERPPRSLRSRLPLTRGRIKSNLPLVRGRAAGGGRGSLTHHLELAFPRLRNSRAYSEFSP